MELKRLCGFCINEWHLTTMILPYLNNKINEKYKIITFLEKNIEDNIKTLTEKLNLKNEEKIKNINWKNTSIKRYKTISNNLEVTNENSNNIIFIYGNKEYIDLANTKINKWVNSNKNIENKIEIVNCYDITDFNYNINEILSANDKIINTSGEREIEEVFENYKKEEAKI